MAKSDLVEVDGYIKKILPGGKFEVEISGDNGSITSVCHLGGKMRMNNIRIVVGDKVTVSLSPYDLTKGVITWRYKN